MVVPDLILGAKRLRRKDYTKHGNRKNENESEARKWAESKNGCHFRVFASPMSTDLEVCQKRGHLAYKAPAEDLASSPAC